MLLCFPCFPSFSPGASKKILPAELPIFLEEENRHGGYSRVIRLSRQIVRRYRD
jgi:hypothetical protein